MNRLLPSFARHSLSEPVSPVFPDFTPLEPRLLMDASLGWDLSGLGGFAEMVSGVHQMLEAQLAGLGSVLDQFTEFTEPALSVLDSFAPAGEGDSAAKIQEITRLLSQAMEQLRTGSELSLRALASDTEGSTRGQNLLAAMDSVLGAGVISPDQLNSVFGFEALSRNEVVARAGTLAGELLELGQGAGKDQAALTADILTAANSVLAGNSSYSVELKDIVSDTGQSVTFSEKADGPGVTVEIELPGFGSGLNGLIDNVFDGLNSWAFGGVALPFDVTLNDGTGSMTFDLVAGRGAVETDPLLWLSVQNFDFDPLVSIGGSIALPGTPGVNLGLLSLTVESLQFAEIAFTLGFASGTDLGFGMVRSADGFDYERLNTDFSLSAGLKIREVGEDAPAAPADPQDGGPLPAVTPAERPFVTLEADKSYALISLGLAGKLDFFEAVTGANGLPFGIGMTMNSVLLSTQDGANPGLATRMERVIAEAQLGFDVDLSGAVAHEELRGVLEETIEGLAAMGMDQITGFLRDVGDSLAGLLRSSMLNFEIPFTDIELSDVLGEIADVFSKLDDLFVIKPSELGFNTGLDGHIATEVTGREALFDPGRLAGMTELRFTLSTQTVDPADATKVIYDLQEVVVDLTGDHALHDVTATLEARTAALAALLAPALQPYGFTATSAGGQLRLGTIGGAAPTWALALTGPKHPVIVDKVVDILDEDGKPTGGTETVQETVLVPWDLSVLGFDESALIEVSDVFGKDTTDIPALMLTAQSSFTWTLPADFAAKLEGMDRLTFSAEVNGQEILLPVLKPADGWGSMTTLQAGIEKAFERAGLEIAVTASVAEGKTSFKFEAAGAEPLDLKFGVNPERLTRAFDLTSLIGWVNGKLATSAHMAGATLTLTKDGALIFDFPKVSLNATTSGHFSLDDLGMGDLSNLSLSARLSAALSAEFSLGVGIDVVGFARSLMGESQAGNALEARRNLDAETSGLQSVGQAMLDSIFFNKFALEAEIAAFGDQIKGFANLGLMDLSIGLDDPSQNFLAINTQFDFTLVGGSAAAGFSDRVSLQNILDAFLNTDAAGETDVLRGLNKLVGRTDLQGGIVTDGAGTALDAEGKEVSTRAGLQIVDADSYTLRPDDVLSQLYLQLGDVRLNVAGISGLNEGIIDGIALSVDDLTNPLESANFRLIGDGAEAIEALGTLGEGDILDSFSTILNLVSVTGEALKEKLPFLAQDIPLLNFSVLDAVDFAKELAAQVQELRDDPQTGLNRLKSVLEDVFGQDTVNLQWDSAAKTLLFGLEFSFLKDFALSLPFNFDLDALIGDKLADIVGPEAAKILTNLADVQGDGNLVFDPDLTMSFHFGLDLSRVLADPPIAKAETRLADLSSVSALVFSSEGAEDLRIRWKDLTDGTSKAVNIDLNGATTLGDAVERINEALQTAVGKHVSFTLDEATGLITLFDANSEKIDSSDVKTFFGADFVVSQVADQLTSLALLAETGGAPVDYAAAMKFHIAFGKDADSLGDGTDLAIPAEAGRTAEGLAQAINEALAAADIARSEVSSRWVGGWTLPAGQLVRAVVVDDVVTLVGTNFASGIGAAPLVFAVSGVDISHAVTFEILEIGGSNAARLLGFDVKGQVFEGAVVSEQLEGERKTGAPRLYLDTVKSGLHLSFTAGAAEGLNLKLGLGPISIAVVDGAALITAGAGSTDPAFISIGFNDIDGTDDTQYDLSDIFNILTSDERSLADLFEVEVGIGIYVDLPFQDSLGLLDPEEHGFTYKADLLKLQGGAPLSGDLVTLFNNGTLTGYELKLPEISKLTSFLDDFNILSLLNNPAQVLNGLDMILGRMQDLFDQYLAGIKLPVVGNAIGSAVTFFTEFRLGALAEAREIANTPKEDGTLPTTVDLLTGWFNDKLNELFNPGGEKIEFIKAFLNTEGGMSDSYIYGAINFSAVIFDQMLDIGFELGLPGFELAVKEGSGIRIALDYSVNLGFGFNKNGFFLLNDTNAKEIRIGVRADAGSFQGSAKLLGVLGISADAVTATEDGFTGIGTAEGTAVVKGELGVDLYGEQGLLIVGRDVTAGAGDIQADFSGIALKDGTGEVLEFERLIYLSKLKSKDLVKFAFNVDVDIQLGLIANILDPTKTGFNPLLIGGYQIIPSAKAELMIQGAFDSTNGLGFVFDRVAFENVRIDASVLYDAIIRPVVEPLMAFIEPLADALGWMQSPPFSLVVDALSQAFPIFGIVNNVLQVVKDISDFVATLHASGGEYVFGSFDFTNSFKGEDKVGKIDTASATLDRPMTANFLGGEEKPFGVFGSLTRGFALEIPLLSDPFSAINLLLGKFDQVDLVKVHFTLLNLNLPRTNFVDLAVQMMGLPGFISKIVSLGLQFEIGAKAYAGISVGYDLSGIVNFVNTKDPLRLLDGIFMDTKPFIDVSFELAIALNLGIVGLTVGGGAGLQLGFNDPNDDGKMRITELIAIINASAEDPGNMLGYIFEGKFDVKFFLDVWVRINLGIISINLDIPVVDIEKSFPFGGLPLPTGPAPKVEKPGGTATLAIGSNIGGSLTDMDKDGDDVVSFGAPAARMMTGASDPGIQVNLGNEQGAMSGMMSGDIGGLIIPAGKGNNTIDMSGLGLDIPIVLYADEGNDVVTLPDQGFVVVFLGDGQNVVRGSANATGTYVIFGGSGHDDIDVPSGNVVFFGDGDYGLRDLFLHEFAQSNTGDAKKDLTFEAVTELLGITREGVIDTSGKARASYNVTSAAGLAERVTLAGLAEDYTRFTQEKASKTADRIIAGNGNAMVFAGGGNDVIRAGMAFDPTAPREGGAAQTTPGARIGAMMGTFAAPEPVLIGGQGEVRVYGGAGHDQITVGGLHAYVEGGAGSDVIRVHTTASSEVWGWGAAAGEDGQLDSSAEIAAAVKALWAEADKNLAGLSQQDADKLRAETEAAAAKVTRELLDAASRINRLAIQDGADLIIGGDGADSLYGQMGNDVIEGGLGADLLAGGRGVDLITGGRFEITAVKDGSTVQLSDYDRNTGFNKAVYLAVQDLADGNDTLLGGRGDDILLGGGGADRLEGGKGVDVMLGDFGRVKLSANLVAERVETIFDSSQNAGNDWLDGGEGNDILIGGGRDETIRDLHGNNIVLGDFGIVIGTRLNEGITSFETRTDAMGGHDTITTGGGNDLIIGGTGNDSITSGEGDDAVIGDDGVIWLLGETDGSVTAILTGTGTATGNDVISLGSGNNRAIGGLGNDRITFADGHNVIIGDTGEILAGEATGHWTAADGMDTVEGGDGRNRVVLGGGDDRAELGDGGNRVIGDAGHVSWIGLADDEGDTMESLEINRGGNDHITTGSGHDVIMGGAGHETIDGGAGNDILLGDNGAWAAPLNGVAGSVTAALGEQGGHDVIYGRTGNDILIGGQGNDTLHAGSGEDLVLGDSGTATFVNATDLVSLTLTDIERGGHDLIEVDLTDTSDDILLGQAGNDTIRAGAGDDVILGDNALFSFLHPDEALEGQTAADRMLLVQSVKMQADEGEDLLYGNDGNDIIIAGFGADLLYGGEGQDILIGDSAIITRRWEDSDKGGLTEWLTIDTNYAFELGGRDTLYGEAGPDIMIGNLGPDLFYGDTASDAIFSDAYAGLFRAWLPQSFKGPAENNQRYLYTSNFAGQGAVDVVSNAQQNAAIGDPLDGRNDDLSSGAGRVVALRQISTSAGDPDLWRTVVDQLDEPDMLDGLARMIAMGAGPEVMADSMLTTLIEAGLISGTIDPLTLELLFERLAEVLQMHVDAALRQSDALPLAAE
ncbi:calcium-binding protein [Falsigemmobacter faecalis]|uniref:Calcium-binding protein n=1 Tax=Falsigemmobacter faecalis TaxID=2488730 RepID=A0A3P3DHW0_9RHOB|nr:calcium-binding protein [Falsigemmobacter faecalis]RRH73849.1 hypothetical protein EG244_12325 [Falsigemmobacter faecalis]